MTSKMEKLIEENEQLRSELIEERRQVLAYSPAWIEKLRRDGWKIYEMVPTDSGEEKHVKWREKSKAEDMFLLIWMAAWIVALALVVRLLWY